MERIIDCKLKMNNAQLTRNIEDMFKALQNRQEEIFMSLSNSQVSNHVMHQTVNLRGTWRNAPNKFLYAIISFLPTEMHLLEKVWFSK